MKIVVLLLTLTGAGSDFDRYADDAEAAVAAIRASASDAQLRAKLQALADQADALIDPFVAARPACREYLAAARTLRQTWSSLDPEAIERDYHHDAKLPKVEDATARAACYQMKDLLVHPLTALRLLAEPAPDRAAIEHEIVEVIAHARGLKAMLDTR